MKVLCFLKHRDSATGRKAPFRDPVGTQGTHGRIVSLAQSSVLVVFLQELDPALLHPVRMAACGPP